MVGRTRFRIDSKNTNFKGYKGKEEIYDRLLPESTRFIEEKEGGAVIKFTFDIIWYYYEFTNSIII